MIGFKSVTSTKRYCQSYDELRNFLGCPSQMLSTHTPRTLSSRAHNSGRARHPLERKAPPTRTAADSRGVADRTVLAHTGTMP
jgi:hypothetical protein